MSQPDKKQGLPLSVILSVVGLIAMLGFALWSLESTKSEFSSSMNTNNFTKNCEIANYVLAKGVDKALALGVPGDMKDEAKKVLKQYDCQGIEIKDTFGDMCYGSVGFTYHSLDQNGEGRFYCSDIDKSVIDQKLGLQSVK